MHEYIGGELAKLRIFFKDPSEYFGSTWKEDFQKSGYGTAVCGRVGSWEPDMKTVYTDHLIHLVKNKRVGCRMRSRFWLGDVEGVGCVGDRVPESMTAGLLKHATEEMATLASKLPELYSKYSKWSNL